MVLHNIGNAMTPINVQIEALKAGRGTDLAQYLEKCYQDLEANAGNLETYVNTDPRGKEVFNYMGELITALTAEENRNGEAIEKMDRAVSYVSEILVMQQAYAAADQEYRETVDLNTLITDAIQIQMDRLERKGITVEQKLKVPLPRVLIDKNRLMQVLLNSLVNGSEAFESLGPDNHQKKIRVKTFADNGHVGFEIEDNGVGIDQDNIEHIFDFGKSYQRSTGLGLYYCKLFVEDNGGTLSISSSDSGAGTTEGRSLKNLLDQEHQNKVLKNSS
jgi:signal transduction histidine kinase